MGEAEHGNAARLQSLALDASDPPPADDAPGPWDDPMVNAILGDVLAQAPPLEPDSQDDGVGALNVVLGSVPSAQATDWGDMGERFNSLGAAAQRGEALPPLPLQLVGVHEPIADLGGSLSTDRPEFRPEPAATPQEVALPEESPELGGAAMQATPALGTDVATTADVAEALAELPTSSLELNTSLGAQPQHQLTGSADPAKINADLRLALEVSGERHQAAAQDALDCAYPQRVYPMALEDEVELGEVDAAQVPETATVPGMQRLLSLGLDPQVELLLDDREGGRFSDHQARSQEALDAASLAFIGRKRSALEGTQGQAALLSVEAQADQNAVVQVQREAIEAAGTQTLSAQGDAVEQLRQEMSAEATRAKSTIDARLSSDQAEVNGLYTKAEQQAQDKLSESEAAVEEQRRNSPVAEDWASMALAAAKRAVSALQDTIGDILKAAHEAVLEILQAARDAATQVVRAGQRYIEGAVAHFEALATKAVNALLAERFPALAVALKEAVTAAMELCRTATQQISTALRAGVEALAEQLEGELDASTRAFEVAVTTTLAAAEAIATGDWDGIEEQLLSAVASAAGINPTELLSFLGQGEATLTLILADPQTFLENLLEAGWGGIQRFGGHLLEHLQAGLLGWLTGAMGGVAMPERLDLEGVFGLVTQLMGLGTDRLWAIAGRALGEGNVERLQRSAPTLEVLFTGGPMALLDALGDSIGDLGATVMGAVKELLLEEVVFAAITKLGAMFTPVGALVQALATAWNMFEFVRDRLGDIVGLAQTLLLTVSDIAKGSLGKAQEGVEQALAAGLPVALDMLARVLGLGGLASKVRKTITQLGDRVEAAIEKWVKRIGGRGRDAPKGAHRDAPTGAGREVPEEAPTGRRSSARQAAATGSVAPDSLLVSAPSAGTRAPVQGGLKAADQVPSKPNKRSDPPHDTVPRGAAESERYIREQGASWSRVKKAYANKDREPVMRALLAFRQRYVDDLIDRVCNTLGGVSAKAFGSTDLTSDYDLSFFGENEVAAVTLFNKDFRSYWGREAGVVFDTNVYTAGEFLPHVGTDHESGEQKITEKQRAETDSGKANDDAVQDVASLVHTRRYMSDPEWKRFRGELERDLSGKAKAQLGRRLDEAEARYARFQREMAERKAHLKAQRDEEEQLYTSRIKTARLGDSLDAQIASEDLELQASNQLYAEKLRALDGKRAQRDALLKDRRSGDLRAEDLDRLESLIVEVRELQAEALQFANESYFSDGAVRHVVGNLQARWGLDMSAQQLLSSFNEQLACVLKDLATYSQADLDDQQKLGKAAFRSSKYIDRLCKAGKDLARVLDAGPDPLLDTLESVAGELLLIRKSREKYAKLGEAEKNLAGVDVLTQELTSIGSVSDLRAFVVKVGADTNARYRAKAVKAQSESKGKSTIKGESARR